MRSILQPVLAIAPFLLLTGCDFFSRNNSEKNSPVAFTYIRAEDPSVVIPIRDAPDLQNSYSAVFKGVITNILDALPLNHIRQIRNIVAKTALGKIEGSNGLSAVGTYTRNTRSIHIDPQWANTPDRIAFVLRHEVGHNVHHYVLKGAEWEEWTRFYGLSSQRGNFPSENAFNAYTGKRDAGGQEDFAECYQLWTGQTTTLASEALRYAESGQTLLLQKYLFMSALFADPVNQTVAMFDGGAYGPARKTSHPFYLFGNSLFLGPNRFDLRDNHVVRVANEFGRIVLDNVSIPLPSILLEKIRLLPKARKIEPSVTVINDAPATLLTESNREVVSPHAPSHYTPILSPDGSLAMTAEQEMVNNPDHVLTFNDAVRAHGNFTVISPTPPK